MRRCNSKKTEVPEEVETLITGGIPTATTGASRKRHKRGGPSGGVPQRRLRRSDKMSSSAAVERNEGPKRAKGIGFVRQKPTGPALSGSRS